MTEIRKRRKRQLKRLLGIALVTSASDGPLPIGEIVGAAIVTGAILYDNWDNIVEGGAAIYGAINNGIDWLFSKGKGERNQTAKPDGTSNPYKKLKPDPNKSGNVLEKNSHTGKTISKPVPPGFFEWW